MADIRVHIQLSPEHMDKSVVNHLIIDYSLSSVNGERAYKFGLISCEMDERYLQKISNDQRVHQVVVDDGTGVEISDGTNTVRLE